jgi:hypothetical protein
MSAAICQPAAWAPTCVNYPGQQRWAIPSLHLELPSAWLKCRRALGLGPVWVHGMLGVPAEMV